MNRNAAQRPAITGAESRSEDQKRGSKECSAKTELSKTRRASSHATGSPRGLPRGVPSFRPQSSSHGRQASFVPVRRTHRANTRGGVTHHALVATPIRQHCAIVDVYHSAHSEDRRLFSVSFQDSKSKTNVQLPSQSASKLKPGTPAQVAACIAVKSCHHQ